jgi:transposase/rRNA maturation endonuclease Nob1
MRKVFLDDLCKSNDGKVDWKNSVGKKLRFTYDGLDGCIELLEYDRGKLKIKYKEEETYMCYSEVKNCMIGVLVAGKRNKDYIYNIDDILEDLNSGKLKILNHIKIKNRRAYHYQCLSCGNVDKIVESSLTLKRGCNVCCNPSKKVLVGYNDIHTVNPELGLLLWNYNDGYKYTSCSNKKVDFKCNNCGEKVKKKALNNISKKGLSCQFCSDGISYSEKFMNNVLHQLGLVYEYQKRFKWSSNRRYDFFIAKSNMIIEMHGIQHYKHTGWERQLIEEQENDLNKNLLAKKNGVYNYIVIDCMESKLEYIKNNILNSELSNIFDLGKVDWNLCDKFSCNSLIKVSCDLFIKGLKTVEIAKILKLNNATIVRYLKKGATNGWCDYDPERARAIGRKISTNSKPIVRLSLDGSYIDEYKSITEAARVLGTGKNISNISSVCSGKKRSSLGYKWAYKENYPKKK